MANLPKLPLPFYTEGVIKPTSIDEMVTLPASVSLAVNFNFDRIGAIQTRPGTTILGSEIVASTPVLGMANYINNAGTIYRLLAKVGGSVYDFDGATWTARRTGLTTSSKARFTSLVDSTFMVNGRGNQACASYAGGSFGSTNVASLPAGDFIENFRSRLWVADSLTDKLYYSDVVTTLGTITGGTSFIQISPQDGDSITGLKRSSNALLVFKRNHIYRVYSINSTDPDPYINVGTYSQESIIETKDGIFFHSPYAFYQYSANPIEISKKINDVVLAIPRSYWPNVCSWEDGDHIYWSIGDITLDGVSLTNMVVRYTASKQLWTLSSYPFEIRSASKYDNGTSLINAVGANNGKVYTFDSGTSDDGTPIFYNVETQFYYISNNKSDLKSIDEMVALFENAQGAQVSYKIDDDSPNTWRPIGQLRDDISQQLIVGAKDFTRIKFKLDGNIIGNSLIFRGFEILQSNVKDK
jgi:hypothetical protein